MTPPPQTYLLLDACVLAGYYAAQTLQYKKGGKPGHPQAAERIATIIDSVKFGCAPHLRLIAPEVCVAEAQTVLSKHANTGWTKQKKQGNKQAIHGKSYKTLKDAMREDFHGARHIESIPLQRYHILAKHLVTAVDHSYHQRNPGNNQHVNALGGMDQIIAGVGVWLNRFLGDGRLIVVSTDYRLVKVLEKCKKLRDTEAKTKGLHDTATDIGLEWSTSLYPTAIHLESISDKQLSVLLGAWPLPTKVVKPTAKSRQSLTESDLDTLVSLYRALRVGRDTLPYSDSMKRLVRDFNRATGHDMTEAEVWTALLKPLKKGLGIYKKGGYPQA